MIPVILLVAVFLVFWLLKAGNDRYWVNDIENFRGACKHFKQEGIILWWNRERITATYSRNGKHVELVIPPGTLRKIIRDTPNGGIRKAMDKANLRSV